MVILIWWTRLPDPTTTITGLTLTMGLSQPHLALRESSGSFGDSHRPCPKTNGMDMLRLSKMGLSTPLTQPPPSLTQALTELPKPWVPEPWNCSTTLSRMVKTNSPKGRFSESVLVLWAAWLCSACWCLSSFTNSSSPQRKMPLLRAIDKWVWGEWYGMVWYVMDRFSLERRAQLDKFFRAYGCHASAAETLGLRVITTRGIWKGLAVGLNLRCRLVVCLYVIFCKK